MLDASPEQSEYLKDSFPDAYAGNRAWWFDFREARDAVDARGGRL